MRKGGFVTKVLQWARQQETLRLVVDQVSNPTWARALAEITTHLLVKAGEDPLEWVESKAGLYHLAGSGTASRFEWGQAILELDPRRGEQTVRKLHPALTADFPTSAARPLYSALDCTKFDQTFGLRLLDWRQSLALAMEL
jgi:dTDP-4-dehydrorhamnose reductase